MMTRLNFDYNLLQNKANFDNYSHGEQRLYCVDNPRGPLTNFNDGGGGGGSDRSSYFLPKKITTSEFVYPKKSLLFLAYPKKSRRLS